MLFIAILILLDYFLARRTVQGLHLIFLSVALFENSERFYNTRLKRLYCWLAARCQASGQRGGEGLHGMLCLPRASASNTIRVVQVSACYCTSS